MNQLLELKENSEAKKSLQNQLKKAEVDLQVAKQKLVKLKKQLKKEFSDVEKLEGQGITALFYSILGSKEKQLDKERQEYLAARLKYENCKNEISELESEIENLKFKISQMGSPEIEYQNILDTKKEILIQKNDEKYLKFEELLGLYYGQKKEISEAISAGEKAMRGLQYAIQSLQKAKNWGTFDMLGGGLLATAVKHSNMDDAQSIIHEVQVHLKRFKRELSDVHLTSLPDLAIQLDSFMSFADYFFDNLIFDWVVQSKINRSLDNCEQMYTQVGSIIQHLKDSDNEVNENYKKTKAQFTTYIESV